MSEWSQATLGDLAHFQRGHDLPTTERRSGTVPVVGSAGVSGFHDVARASAPGVVIGRSGASMGHATYVTRDFWPLNTSLYVTDFLGNDPRFVYYLLKTIDFDSLNSGSAQPSLNRNYFKHVSILLPAVQEQKCISSLLGALDDKIAANDRIAATSDALIRTKYECAIKKGSRLMALPSALRITFGAPFRSSEFNSAKVGIPLIRIRDLTTFDPQVWTTERRPRDFVVEPGETIIGMDAEFQPTFWLGVAGLLNQRVMRATSLVGGGPVLAREALREPLARVQAYKTGTTVAHLNKSDLERLETSVPTESAMAALERETTPLHGLLVSLSKQSKTLAYIRDTLLPELMSGRLRVKDVEKVVEEAV